MLQATLGLQLIAVLLSSSTPPRSGFPLPGKEVKAPHGMMVSTLAGVTQISDARSEGTSYEDIQCPRSLVVDALGVIYLTDAGSSAIHKLIPSGEMSVLAGQPKHYGSEDGEGSEARFHQPRGLAIDRQGTIYVADGWNHAIRRITPGGMVSTVAGVAGKRGSTDGPAREARFNDPSGVTLDLAGNIYVADRCNGTIRKITPTGMVSTLAGKAGSHGCIDGRSDSARLDTPSALAADANGNIYAIDGNAIRKITPEGHVSTLAGSCQEQGYEDGPGKRARFCHLADIALDASGNLHVTDTNNFLVRKISSAGVVSTLAGCRTMRGSADGFGLQATFNSPSGITLDPSGNTYVIDQGNRTIRKVTPEGQVSTCWGIATYGASDGPGSRSRFNWIKGLVTDASGTSYVSDSQNHTIRKISRQGVVSTLAGQAQQSGDNDGCGSEARFCNPQGLALDAAGNIYVADLNNQAIRKITPDGSVSTILGRKVGSAFGKPVSVAVDASHTLIVATETSLLRIRFPRVASYSDPRISILAGVPWGLRPEDGKGIHARFLEPSELTTDPTGNIYMTDAITQAIHIISPAGKTRILAGQLNQAGSADGMLAQAQFSNPRGMAADAEGHIYVADSWNHTIRKVRVDGSVCTWAGAAGQPGAADGPRNQARFNHPDDLAMDTNGNLYVADGKNATIRKITPEGQVSTLAGRAGYPGSSDGLGSIARFSPPLRLAVDRHGFVFVAEHLTHRIRKITPEGLVKTFAGGLNESGFQDGPGLKARFNHPSSLTLDRAGNIYIADRHNAEIRKITPRGMVSTLAGSLWQKGHKDGLGQEAAFSCPTGIASDGSGNIYVADSGSGTIRKITAKGHVSTLAGIARQGSRDGRGSVARFNGIHSVVLDALGNTYASDEHNHTIRKISPEGIVSTLAGAPGDAGHEDGVGGAARFNRPRGLALDAAGNLYVADELNNAIRKITPGGAVSTPLGRTPVCIGCPSSVQLDAEGGLIIALSTGILQAVPRPHP